MNMFSSSTAAGQLQGANQTMSQRQQRTPALGSDVPMHEPEIPRLTNMAFNALGILDGSVERLTSRLEI